MMLSEIICLLPIMAAISVVGFGLISQSFRVQGYEQRLINDEARMNDLVRRLQADVGRAATVRLDQAQNSLALQLGGPAGAITYEATGSRVRCSERVGDESVTRSEWAFEQTEVAFQIESIGSRPAVVWSTFTITAPAPRGPEEERQLAAAALVGRGGAS